jgi:hypothetical protein
MLKGEAAFQHLALAHHGNGPAAADILAAHRVDVALYKR